MSLHERFSEYFSALERSGGEDRCFLCRRTPADVKQFFGFREDGTVNTTPGSAAQHQPQHLSRQR